jgi:hypothetical protein
MNHHNFFKNIIPYFMHTSPIVCTEKKFYPLLKKWKKLYRISRKRVKFELQVFYNLLKFFFQKSILGTQVSILSEIHKELCKILFRPRNGHARRFGRILKSMLEIQKNQKNTKPSRCVMLCDLVHRKNYYTY